MNNQFQKKNKHFVLVLLKAPALKYEYANIENLTSGEVKGLIDNLKNRNNEDTIFNKEYQNYFEEAIGEKANELILIDQEKSIHEIIVRFDDDKLSKIIFKEFIERIYDYFWKRT